MISPPGLKPSHVSHLDNATPTSLMASAIAEAVSRLPIGVDMPLPSMTAVIATATSIATAHVNDKPGDNGECRLLGPFAILVQGSLGLLALLALVYKRWKERPQRPMKIWFFDVSKQVVGSVLVHMANLLMSLLSSGQLSIKLDASIVAVRGTVDEAGHYTPNPCSFYLLNLAIDTTVGIPILIILLRLLTALLTLTPVGSPPESIESGNYGSPPRSWWWFKQSIIYFIGLMGMKICVLIIFLVFPWISRVGDWALGWTEGDEVLQVMFVMLIFPVIMNATQYYIIDSFIKSQRPPSDHERLTDNDGESSSFDEERDSTEYEDPLSGSSEEIRSGDEDDVEVLVKVDSDGKTTLAQTRKIRSKQSYSSNGKAEGRISPRKEGLIMGKNYDPMFDGERSPTVVGSASTSERDRLMHEEDGSDDPGNGAER